MPEYFDISLIINNKPQTKSLSTCLANKFNLHEGKNSFTNNKYALLANKPIICGIYNDENRQFEEYCISIPDLIFHADSFKKELTLLTIFINDCFEFCDSIEFVLCSYEINSYLISKVSTLNDFNDQFLSKFPIVYVRKQNSNIPLIKLNLNAQDIFVDQAHSITFDKPLED